MTALSLSGLRRKIEAALSPDDVTVRLHLDRAAELERRRRTDDSRFTACLQNLKK